MLKEILIIDDDPAFRGAMTETLNDLGWDTIQAGSVDEALKLAEQGGRFFAIFIDYKMPYVNGVDGLALLKKMKSLADTPIVMITSYLDAATTVEAISKGAFDYLTKPISRRQIESLLEKIKLQFVETAEQDKEDESKLTTSFVCVSASMREILKQVGRISQSDLSVLITGETGTGKELIARMIHSYSQRKNEPFIAINCAAIPAELLESELFGHTKGSFTGAVADKVGAFARAQGGTIFLDEIGDMSLSLQAKLLRVLQEKEVTPVGSTKTVRIDARFVSATHRDLRESADRREFREDLFFRLNAAVIRLPALRDRREDIPALAKEFLKPFSGKMLSADGMDKLLAYEWPGNVRELKNVVENAAAMTPGRLITEDSLSLSTRPSRPNPPAFGKDAPPLSEAIATLEKELISAALERAHQNKTEAAKSLGIGRQLLYTKMKLHGLSD